MLAKLRNRIAWLLGGSTPRNRAELGKLLKLTAKRTQRIPVNEIAMLQRVLELSEQRVENVMIPHGRVDWLHTDDTLQEILEQAARTRHSRYPVVDKESDTVVGILHIKQLVGIASDKSAQVLADTTLLQPARVVPESKRLDTMLREFQHYRLHMMIVAEESGKPVGMVTIEDVLESIVGAINDEFDTQEDVRATIRPAGSPDSWEIDGDTSLEKFNEQFDLELDKTRFDTVNGWLSHKLGRLPRTGETVIEGALQLEIAKSGPRRVEMVKATRLAADADKK